MPSVTYMNQSAPFWDFIAGLEQQGNDHPFFSHNRNQEGEHAQGPQLREGVPFDFNNPFNLGGWGRNAFGGQALSHRGPPPRHHEASHEGTRGDETNEKAEESNKEKEPEKNDEEMKDRNDNGEGPAGNSGSDNEGCAWGRGRHGRCGGARRQGRCGPGGWGGPRHGGSHPGHHEGPRGGPFGGPPGPPGGPQWPFNGPRGPHGGPHHGHGHDHGVPRGFGRRGGWERGGMFGSGFDPADLAAHFFNQANQFNQSQTTNEGKDKSASSNEDHIPDADVFDTENAFVVHIPLPGAKKEDVGVNWDVEKSELSVAGVIYRPGDEEFLKTLAVNERKVGPFERKIRLGTRASPAHIDADGITAKLEDGILRVEVPKLDAGYVEIKKVDIE
jgi:HSP20 family protein